MALELYKKPQFFFFPELPLVVGSVKKYLYSYDVEFQGQSIS